MRKFIVIFLFIAIGSTSCEELANQSLPNDVVFFDLKAFMTQEINRLNSQKPTVKKTTGVNGQTETKTLQLKDFQTELKIFQEADINKLAWIDKYQADSVFVGNQLLSIAYTAMENKLTTKELKVDFKDGVVSKIHVATKASSIVTDVEKQLIYEPDIRYSILSKQNTTGSSPNEVKVEGEFLN